MFNFSNDLWRKHGVRWWWPLSLAVMSTRHWRWLLRRSFVSHYYVVVVISLPSLKKKRLTIMWGSSFLRKRLLIFFFLCNSLLSTPQYLTMVVFLFNKHILACSCYSWFLNNKKKTHEKHTMRVHYVVFILKSNEPY